MQYYYGNYFRTKIMKFFIQEVSNMAIIKIFYEVISHLEFFSNYSSQAASNMYLYSGSKTAY